MKAGIVGRGQQQEGPGFESRGKCAYTDAILPNALIPLASRFEADGINSWSQRTAATQRSRAVSRSTVSLRASERPREPSWA